MRERRTGRSRRAFLKRVVAAGALASASASRPDGSLGAQQPGRIRSIDHVSFPMENTQAMVAFYRGLGIDVLHDDRRCHLRFDDQKIHFHQPHMWRRETFTLRGPRRCRVAATSASCGRARRSRCGPP